MERRKMIWRWPGLAALVAVMLVAAAACGGDDEEAAAPPPPADTAVAPEPAPTPEPAEPPPAAPGLGSAFDVASAGDVTLNLWWLGAPEGPGVEPWVEETMAALGARYPHG